MYSRSTAPPGAGRYSTPSSSSPSDPTVGASSAAISYALSVIVPLVRTLEMQTKRGPVGPFVQYRWIPAWPPAAGDHEAQASRKRKRLRRAFNATRKSVVAGAGFEPATFGL